MRSEFIYDRGPYPQVHASTLAETTSGQLVAAWFGGTEEGHPDVSIWVARYENESRETYDQLGRRVVVPVRTFRERKGFVLEPKFVFIDGRTGATLYSETQRREVLYPLSQSTPALASYFELMDQLIPDFLGALSTQKIRGSRILLR